MVIREPNVDVLTETPHMKWTDVMTVTADPERKDVHRFAQDQLPPFVVVLNALEGTAEGQKILRDMHDKQWDKDYANGRFFGQKVLLLESAIERSFYSEGEEAIRFISISKEQIEKIGFIDRDGKQSTTSLAVVVGHEMIHAGQRINPLIAGLSHELTDLETSTGVILSEDKQKANFLDIDATIKNVQEVKDITSAQKSSWLQSSALLSSSLFTTYYKEILEIHSKVMDESLPLSARITEIQPKLDTFLAKLTPSELKILTEEVTLVENQFQTKKHFVETLTPDQKTALSTLDKAKNDASLTDKDFTALYNNTLPILLENPSIMQLKTLDDEIKKLKNEIEQDATRGESRLARELDEKAFVRSCYEATSTKPANAQYAPNEVIPTPLTEKEKAQNDQCIAEYPLQTPEEIKQGFQTRLPPELMFLRDFQNIPNILDVPIAPSPHPFAGMVDGLTLSPRMTDKGSHMSTGTTVVALATQKVNSTEQFRL